MIQGTTPIHIFELPFDVSVIQNVEIIYSQNGKIILKKEKHDCELNGNEVKTELAQVDTLSFETNGLVKIQIRILSVGGEALASIPIQVNVIECLNKEVLV